jgi:hypothetical protein
MLPTVRASISSGSSSREMSTRSPEAVTNSIACTAVASPPLPTPDPCVPFEQPARSRTRRWYTAT